MGLPNKGAYQQQASSEPLAIGVHEAFGSRIRVFNAGQGSENCMAQLLQFARLGMTECARLRSGPADGSIY
jgi:hypothetical protein